MPVYLYECEDCGERFEAKQSFSEAPLKICPTCEGPIHRVIQPVGVVFKGSGFYVTDSRGKQNLATSGTRKDEAKPAESGDSSSTSSSTESSAAKPEKTETKPANATTGESK